MVPERRYDLAGQLLASAIDRAAAEGFNVVDALAVVAAHWGGTVGDQARETAGPRASRDHLTATICQVLIQYGYEPHREGGRIVLRNCPFEALAREHTQLVCGMNLSIMTAVADRASKTRLQARLEPEPRRCCVVLDAG
jgi:predicted ArsR family transcriptional regulator